MDKLALFKKIDRYLVGPLLLFFPKLKTRPIANIKKILVIKTVAIGDLVLILPTLRALKETFPNAQITLLTTPRVKEVVEGFRFIHRIIYYDILGSDKGIRGFVKTVKKIKEKEFDLCIDLEHYYNFTALLARLAGVKQMAGFTIDKQIRKKLFNVKIPYDIKKHEAEVFYEAALILGAKNRQIKLEPIATSPEDKVFIERFLEKHGIKDYERLVCVHPSTSDSAKVRRWLPERFAQLSDYFIEELKAKVIVTGSKQDKDVIQSLIDNSNKKPIIWPLGSSIKQFAELSRRCNLFISVDTGPMHVAAAMGTETIGLFGPNTPKKWAPYGFEDLAVYKALDCSPCTKQYLGQVSKCKSGKCMEQIDIQDVLRVVKRILR